MQKSYEKTATQKSTKPKKNKKKAGVPAWAKTEAQQEEQKEAEIDDLLEFAYGLDYEEYMEDYEVRQALAIIKDRVNEITKETDWKEKMAEEWNEANEAEAAQRRELRQTDQNSEVRSTRSYNRKYFKSNSNITPPILTCFVCLKQSHKLLVLQKPATHHASPKSKGESRPRSKTGMRRRQAKRNKPRRRNAWPPKLQVKSSEITPKCGECTPTPQLSKSLRKRLSVKWKLQRRAVNTKDRSFRRL